MKFSAVAINKDEYYRKAKAALRYFVRTGSAIYSPMLVECGVDELEIPYIDRKGRRRVLQFDCTAEFAPVEARQRFATLAVRLLDEYIQKLREEQEQEKEQEKEQEQEEKQEQKQKKDQEQEQEQEQKQEQNEEEVEGFSVEVRGTEVTFGGGGPGITPPVGTIPPVARELCALFEKLAFERAPYGRTAERERWDARLLARGRFVPNRIPVAKSGHEVDHEIYFVLDNSGSMAPHAAMLAALLEASRHVVRVYMGSEAHPQEAADGSYRAPYRHSFADQLEEWLTAVHPAPGSVLIFWGDTCDMHVRGEEARVRRLLRPYRAYWLGTYIQDDYSGWEQPCLPAAGFRVIAPVTTPVELRAAVKRIK